MAKFYDVTLRTSAKDLGTFLSLIEGAAELISVKGSEEPARKAPKSFAYANGAHNKGIKGEELVLQLLQSGPMTYTDVALKFKEAGFMPQSCSPVLSKLKSAGKLTNVGGRWSLA